MAGPIIVPLDGSQLAEHAVPFGMSLAKRLKTELLLLRLAPIAQSALVLGDGRTIPLEAQEASLRVYADAYLADVAKTLKPQGVPVRTLALAALAGEGIARVAEEQEAAYIVMSTHGQRGITRWALGSVTDRVLHLTHRPLIILPPRTPTPELGIPMADLKRIVVPLDGSPLGESALFQAKALAAAYQAELLLFRTMAPQVLELTEGAFPGLQDGWWESTLAEARLYLREIEDSLRAEGFQVRHELGLEQPAEAILQFASQEQAGLIVMSTQARGGMSRALLGSVTDRVARSGQIPVLAVRPQEND